MAVFECYDVEVSDAIDAPEADLRYSMTGDEDDVAAVIAARAGIPLTFQALPRQSLKLTHQGAGVWDVKVHYARRDATTTQYCFDTGGGQQKVMQSISTVNKYLTPSAPGGAVVPDFKGAISVNRDRVEGVEIHVPNFSFKETHYIPLSKITPAYIQQLYQLTGTVNQATFRGKQAGECLFLGAQGSQRGFTDAEISFSFACSPNVTSQTIGDIAGINKKGWEYLWIRYQEDVSNGVLIHKPYAVYIEQVYKTGDFTQLGIGNYTFIANLDGLPVVLDRARLGAILTGQIGNWQQLGYSNTSIVVVTRSTDPQAFTDFMTPFGSGYPPFNSTSGGSTDASVNEEVMAVNGHIGYVDAEYAETNNLPVVLGSGSPIWF